ncbi:MAG: HDOD domain-containing protein [Rheinheimera sp.]|nr:HDOD domain-containing protein [Rheinheimera sp.]
MPSIYCSLTPPALLHGLEEKRLVCFMAPLALRVVVTEPQHEDVILNHLEHFHSFVGHDLSYDHLQQLFANAARLSMLPLQESERRLIGRLTEYPVFPSICQELRELLKDPQVELVRVTSLVSRDPLIVSRLLQLVNSPYMGFASETWSLHTAINRLGFQMLQTLVLMLSIKARQAELGHADHESVLDAILADARLSAVSTELRLSTHHARSGVYHCNFKWFWQVSVIAKWF